MPSLLTPCRTALLVALIASAGTAPAQGPMGFADFDQDGNGLVSEQEFAAARAERMAARAAQGAPMRGAANAPAFADIDQNADGQLTPEELQSFHQARRQGRGMGAGAGQGSGMGPGAGMGPGMGMAMPTFAEFDLDGNGTLTSEEFYNARAQHMRSHAQQGYPMRNAAYAPTFEQIDANADELIDAEEFSAGQAAHRQRMMQQP